MASRMNLLRHLCRNIVKTAKKPCTSVSLLIASACAADESRPPTTTMQPLKLLDKKEMTHEALIRQACTLTANSSSQLLTQVLIAINDTSQGYRKEMSELMVLLEESLLLLTNSRSTSLDEIEDLIVQQRIVVDEQRRLLMELVSLMDYVEKMVTSTAETAYLAGAEHSSTLMCQRLNSALTQVGEECAANKQSEEELLKLQGMYIIKLGELYEREWNAPEDNSEKEVKKNINGVTAVPVDLFENASLNEEENNGPEVLE